MGSALAGARSARALDGRSGTMLLGTELGGKFAFMFTVRDEHGQVRGNFKTRAEAKVYVLRQRGIESVDPELVLPPARDLHVLANLYYAWGKTPAPRKVRLIRLGLVSFHRADDSHAFLTPQGAHVLDEARRRGLV